ncbi:MAG: 4-hydroxyphenyl-beta-ketoacyl-CoA hydrolase [Blastococcus sp.]|jgi:predicted TIM-barrel fold metal-dependent hydrolase|nr:4-hydroxyphenyl-beta-ketoacyl-CoA hydrolase [Blastococcus sp.]
MSIPADLVAIDVHTHPQTEEFLAAMGSRRSQMAKHFKREQEVVSFSAQADAYRDRKMMAVILNSDSETTSGLKPAPNDLLGKAQSDHPDVFLAFAGIDPWKGRAAVDEIRRCHAEFGIYGVGELNPSRQKFLPNDRRFFPIWETCAELGLVVMFHAGFPGAGAGTPGGGGYKLEYARPVPYIDDVAAELPELKIIAAHPAWPWHLESLAMVWHKTNVYLDLSGWAPKYLAPEVVRYADSLISDRVLFGSDWPVMTVERWMADFENLELKASSRRKILLDNAVELFGLSTKAT